MYSICSELASNEPEFKEEIIFVSLSKPEWSNITQHLVVDSVYGHYMPHVCFKSSDFEIDAPYEKTYHVVFFWPHLFTNPQIIL